MDSLKGAYWIYSWNPTSDKLAICKVLTPEDKVNSKLITSLNICIPNLRLFLSGFVGP